MFRIGAHQVAKVEFDRMRAFESSPSTEPFYSNKITITYADGTKSELDLFYNKEPQVFCEGVLINTAKEEKEVND